MVAHARWAEKLVISGRAPFFSSFFFDSVLGLIFYFILITNLGVLFRVLIFGFLRFVCLRLSWFDLDLWCVRGTS